MCIGASVGTVRRLFTIKPTGKSRNQPDDYCKQTADHNQLLQISRPKHPLPRPKQNGRQGAYRHIVRRLYGSAGESKQQQQQQQQPRNQPADLTHKPTTNQPAEQKHPPTPPKQNLQRTDLDGVRRLHQPVGDGREVGGGLDVARLEGLLLGLVVGRARQLQVLAPHDGLGSGGGGAEHALAGAL